MKANMSNVDRVIRIIVSVIIAALAYTNIISGTLAIVLLVLAGVFILTSIFGICPLYSLFGIRTTTVKKNTA